MNLDLSITLIISIVNAFLGIYILLSNYKKKSNIFFFLFILFLILWKVTLFLYYDAKTDENLLLIGKVNFAVSSLMAYFAFKFVEIFPNNINRFIKSRILSIILDLFNICVIYLTMFTSLISQDELIKEGEKQTIFGEFYSLYLIHLTIFLLLTLISVWVKYRKSIGYNREQLKLIFWSFLVATIFGTTTNIIFPYILNIFSFQTLGPLGTILISIAIFISIVKYKFLDTKVILAQILHTLILSGFTYLAFYFVAYTYISFYNTIFSIEAYVMGIFVAVLFVSVYEWIRKFVKSRVEDPIIYGVNRPDYVISEISSVINQEVDFDKIISQVSKVFEKFWGIKDVHIIILNHVEPKIYSLTNTKQIDIKSVISLLPNEYKKPILIDSSNKDVLYTELESESSFIKLLETKNFDIGIRLIIPITLSDRVTGYIMLGSRINNEIFNQKDIEILSTVTNIIGLATTRASLFNEVKTFNQTLQTKVDIATQEVRQQKEELSEQLRKEKDMMDILGHELRTPLSIARNAVAMMKTAIPKIEENDVQFELNNLYTKALENIRREVKILETVLSSTRIENNRLQIIMEKVDVKDVVNVAIEGNITDANKKGLKLYTAFGEGDILAFAARDQMQEVVDNLVSNAIKYTEKGEIRIESFKENGYVVVSVKDTGEGIPSEAIPNLGKKFFRVNPYLSDGNERMNVIRPGGTGIGLYVVFNLVKLMRGTIEIKSQVGVGSNFTIKVPGYNVIEREIKPTNNM